MRVKNPIKSLYRSRGVRVAGRSVYSRSDREEFLVRLPKPASPLTELLYEELDALTAMAMAFLELREYGIVVVSAYWGLWLFPFGLLVMKSGFFPRILGIVLIIAGFADVVGSFIALLAPDFAEDLSWFLLVPEVAGELSMMLWLLVKGAKVKPAAGSAA